MRLRSATAISPLLSPVSLRPHTLDHALTLNMITSLFDAITLLRRRLEQRKRLGISNM
jgi:hypothetical protein